MNKIKRDKFNSKKNMSNPNISFDNNNNPLNIFQNNPSTNNEQEAFPIPKNVGPYEIIKKLKDGGYSQIYLAKTKYTGDEVCIKLIKKTSFQENIEDLLLATRQKETLKILKHRNILTLLEIYESPNYIFLITEYLSGKDLIERLIAKKRFNEEEAQKIFFQLVDALFYMHKMNICHRDIRTEHILFDKKNTPKIIGFSYSTFYNKNQKLKDSFGSLCYACPEIIQENSYDPELADVWSLGVVLYVMVCGYLPFSEENDEKNKELIIRGKIEFPKEISNKLKDLLRHMLDINTNKRYNFVKIMKHPWFKPYNEQLLKDGCNLYKMVYPVDEKILNIIRIYDFDKKAIENDMKKNKFNNGTGLYRHLVLKLGEMGLKSISDFSSNEFLQYKKDKNNYIIDGENNYNIYLNKVQKIIEKIEKIISDSQEKEENIIQQLNNLEELNISMMKNNLEKSKINNSIYSEESSSIYSSSESDKNSQKSEKSEKIEKFKVKNNGDNINNNKNKSKKKEVNPILKTKTNFCHRRTITPAFTFRGMNGNNEMDSSNSNHNTNKNEDGDLDEESGGINKNEKEIISKSKKTAKIKNIIFYINKELQIENIFNSEYLNRSKSCPNVKNLVTKLLSSRVRFNNKNSKNNDMIKKVDESHNITSSYIRLRDTSMVIRRKKNYLNSSSFLDGYLKKPHPDNLKKNNVKNNLINNINQIIIEENINNSIINNSGNNSNNQNQINNENKKSRIIKYSLSFGDDDEDESSYISNIDSRQVSIYDDEYMKVLKEINNAKSPNLKSNSNKNNNNENSNNFSRAGSNRIISNFDDKNQNFILTGLNNNSNFRNSQNNKKINNTNKNTESPIIFYSNKAEMSFHEEIKDNDTDNEDSNNNKKIFNDNKNNNIKSSSEIKNNNKINNNIFINDDKKDKDNDKNKNHLLRCITFNMPFNEEKKEISTFIIDKKIISKLNFNNEKEELLSINSIHSQEQDKYLYSYFKDSLTIKKLDDIFFNNDKNLFSISDIENNRPHKESKLKKKENNKFYNRNNNLKNAQKKTLDIKTNKEKNVAIIENNNTTKKNKNNQKEILYNNGYSKKYNNKGINNNLTGKKAKKKESVGINNFTDNNNKASRLEKENNKKFNKNLKLQNNLNNNKITDKNKPINNPKQDRVKIKKDLNNKFQEELNFTNFSDLSEIRGLSISPTYINSNMENKNPNFYDNQDNTLFSNILQNKSNYISFDKSFQSQFQIQNKTRYNISSLLVSHENNIICMGNKDKKTKEYKKNDYNMNFCGDNNFNGEGRVKKIMDNSNSKIYLEEINDTCNTNINTFSNYDNYTHRIYNYDSKKETYKDQNYLNQNSYNNNYIVTIKKRNLAEKLKEEIQKSMNKNNINFPSSIITNGRVNFDNNIKKDIIESDNNNNFNSSNIYDENIFQSNGKKIRDKIIKCPSLISKDNIYSNNESNSNSNNQKTFTENYQNNISMHNYDLNNSKYITQYININNNNTNINKNININNNIHSINHQSEQFLINKGNNKMKSRDSSVDYFFNCSQIENKINEYVNPKRKTIKIKKRLSNSINHYENTERNNSLNPTIRVNKYKIKSNGKNNNQSFITNIEFNNTSATTKRNYKKDKNLLLKNINYKCINGKTKNTEINNDNVLLLSKHKKNYDNNNIPEKLITCSVPDLNNNGRKKKNLNLYQNQNAKKEKLILSHFILPNTRKNKSIDKKSFSKNKERNNNYRKKISTNNNIIFENSKDKTVYNKNNRLTHKTNMELYNIVGKNKNIVNRLNKKEENNKNEKNNYLDNNLSSKKPRKKSGNI